MKFISNFLFFVFFITIIIGVHFGIYKLLVGSEYLTINKINISGNHYTSKKEIERLASYTIGEGILDVSLSDVKDRVMSILLIKDVNVKRNFPDALNIEITERKPLAQLLIDKNYYLCDEEGFVLSTNRIDNIIRIVIDFDINIYNNMINDQVIITTLNILNSYNHLSEIDMINIKAEEGFYIVAKDSLSTLFFIGKNFPDKDTLDKVISIARKIKKDNIKIKYVDINDENVLGFK